MALDPKYRRRMNQETLTVAELAIHKAMEEVEKMPADTRLTDALCFLANAKSSVADFVDGVPSNS